jgi:hypothetical protein
MKELLTKLRTSTCVVVCVCLALVVYMTLQSCKKDGTPRTETECQNGLDDDGDDLTDCDDMDCFMNDPACQSDGDSDTDNDGDTDGDGDTDTDTDTDVDTDTDTDVDGDSDGCSPDTGACEYPCDSDDDCQLALDMLNCCGGVPHTSGGETVVCATAEQRERVGDAICVIPWSPGDPVPELPEECRPFCTGVVCPVCVPLASVACRDGTCLPIAAERGCIDEDDCPEGQACADVDGDGVRQCEAGPSHECETEADCLAAHATCSGCNCHDVTGDTLRECECWDCGEGICFSDMACEPHHFCNDNRCEFGGEDACRVRMGGIDCPDPCLRCEPSATNPDRGTCVIIELPDGGLCEPIDGGV